MAFDFKSKIRKILGKEPEHRPALSIGTMESRLAKAHSIMLQYQKPPVHYYAYKWKRAKKHVSIYPTEEPNPHIVIAGMSGLGKSTLLKSLLYDMHKNNISCVLFDSNNEHEAIVRNVGGNVIDASSMGINLLELDGSTINDRIDELTGLMSSVYSLGYLQSTKLNSCLWYTYMHSGARSRSESYIEKAPNISDMLNELSVFISRSRSKQESGTLRNMYQKLSTLKRSAFRQSEMSLSNISKSISSFSLASMHNDKARLIYINELVRRLYRTMHSASMERGVSMYIMLDESQLILNDDVGSAIVGNIIEEGRKFGFGTIIVSHMASKLDKRIIANTSTFITFYAKEPGEINYVSNVLSGALPDMQNTIKEKLRTLDKYEAIMTSSANKMPVVVKMAKPAALRAIDDKHAEKIISMLAHPMRIEKIYELIKGADISRAVQGLIDTHKIDSINIDGEQFLMKHNSSLSIEHEASIAKIHDKLSACGIRSTVNTSMHGPDIIAESSIAIEYETGRKSIGSTVRMLANRKNYSKIIVIVNDAHFNEYIMVSNAVKFGEFMHMDCKSISELINQRANSE